MKDKLLLLLGLLALPYSYVVHALSLAHKSLMRLGMNMRCRMEGLKMHGYPFDYGAKCSGAKYMAISRGTKINAGVSARIIKTINK